MSKGYMRCEFMNPQTGLQCEIWEESSDSSPFLCREHKTIPSNGNGKTQYIETVNIQREFCYKMFEGVTLNEGFSKLDEHIAKIEAAIEEQKQLFYTARAVKADKLSLLSEDERKERLKYKVKKVSAEPKEKSTSVKTNPIAHLQKHGISKDKAQDLMTMDLDELMKKYKLKKEESK